MTALRHHRRPGPGVFSALTLISLALVVTPWVFPSVMGLALGLGAHVLWFSACERLAPQHARGQASADGQEPARAQAPSPAPKPTDPAPRPPAFVQVPVLAVFEETPDIRTFRMARPEGFEFVSGQFLPIRVRIDGREHVRCYSISSSPAARGYLEISVKRQGLVSNALHAIARPGALLTVKHPAGAFVYPAADDRPLLLIAGGIGITPLLSMLRHAVETEPSRSVTLLYSAVTEDGLAFRDEIRMLVGRHPQARSYFAVSGGAGGPDLDAGRIDETLVRAAMPDVSQAIALICGPPAMIQAMRALLSSLGMPAAQIRSELFEAAVAASTGHVPDATPQSAGAVAVATAVKTHDVTCARSQKAVRAQAGQTLLDAAEAGGVAIDSLCRSGVCGTCRTKVIRGDVHCESTVLDEADRASGHVLACVARVHSDCEVDA